MKRFLLIHNGPPAPPDATHEGRREWFANLGEALAGYCIVQAEDTSAAIELVRDHPLLAPGSQCTIEIFEVPRR